MLDLKKKALGGIQAMLEDRMTSRLKPKAVSVEIETVGKKPLEEEGEETLPMKEEAMESPEGGDMSSLTPEEQSQLQMLLEKMGC